MIEIINNCIYHRRGDTGSIAFTPAIDGQALSMYTATFTVKKDYDDETPVLQKPVDAGMISFTHADTKDLPYGIYVYDIEVQYVDSNGIPQVETFGPYQYYLRPDVTR